MQTCASRCGLSCDRGAQHYSRLRILLVSFQILARSHQLSSVHLHSMTNICLASWFLRRSGFQAQSRILHKMLTTVLNAALETLPPLDGSRKQVPTFTTKPPPTTARAWLRRSPYTPPLHFRDGAVSCLAIRTFLWLRNHGSVALLHWRKQQSVERAATMKSVNNKTLLSLRSLERLRRLWRQGRCRVHMQVLSKYNYRSS